MIVSPQKSWWRVVLRYHGSELPRTQYRIAGVFLMALGVTVLADRHDWHPNLTKEPFTLIGVALGIFLGFRNNASYDRWWEGRKLWGAAVNTTRSFTRQILTLLQPRPDSPPGEAEELRALRGELVYRVIAWAHALRMALRDEDDLSELTAFLPADELLALREQRNRPLAITHTVAQKLSAAWREGRVHTMHLPLLEQSMVSLTDIQGGCERIKLTAIPFSYTTLIHRITAVYCYALPFGLVDVVGMYTPIVCVIVAYAFFGLDVVGDEIEAPFGEDPNDLPLRAIARTIEINLRQALGETDLPPPLVPVNEVLN